MNYRFSSSLALCAMWITIVAIPAPAATASANPGARKFDHAELFAGTSTGQKKAGGSTKGALIFNSEKKMVEFQAQKGHAVQR